MVLAHAVKSVEMLLFYIVSEFPYIVKGAQRLTRQISFLLQMIALHKCPERVQGQKSSRRSSIGASSVAANLLFHRPSSDGVRIVEA